MKYIVKKSQWPNTFGTSLYIQLYIVGKYKIYLYEL
jgi:hypothetical protein